MGCRSLALLLAAIATGGSSAAQDLFVDSEPVLRAVLSGLDAGSGPGATEGISRHRPVGSEALLSAARRVAGALPAVKQRTVALRLFRKGADGTVTETRDAASGPFTGALEIAWTGAGPDPEDVAIVVPLFTADPPEGDAVLGAGLLLAAAFDAASAGDGLAAMERDLRLLFVLGPDGLHEMLRNRPFDAEEIVAILHLCAGGECAEGAAAGPPVLPSAALPLARAVRGRIAGVAVGPRRAGRTPEDVLNAVGNTGAARIPELHVAPAGPADGTESARLARAAATLAVAILGLSGRSVIELLGALEAEGMERLAAAYARAVRDGMNPLRERDVRYRSGLDGLSLEAALFRREILSLERWTSADMSGMLLASLLERFRRTEDHLRSGLDDFLRRYFGGETPPLPLSEEESRLARWKPRPAEDIAACLAARRSILSAMDPDRRIRAADVLDRADGTVSGYDILMALRAASRASRTAKPPEPAEVAAILEAGVEGGLLLRLE